MKVLITPRGFANNGMDQVQVMRNQGLVVDYNNTGLPYTDNEFREKSKDSDAIIVGVDLIDQNVIDQCKNLKVICKFGVGTDNIDVDYAKTKGIYVGRTVGSNSNAVAEHVMAFMYAWAKNLPVTINEVKQGSWNKPTGSELSGKILGIVGFGAIGKLLAKKAIGIGMKVLVNDVYSIGPEIAKSYDITVETMDTILNKCDYISLHLPLLDSTKNMISDEQFHMMKKNAVLINAARGGIVDESALYRALTVGDIQAACFDVFTSEPPSASEPLLKLDNFLLTAHTAARTIESDQRTCALSTKIVLEHLGLR